MLLGLLNYLVIPLIVLSSCKFRPEEKVAVQPENKQVSNEMVNDITENYVGTIPMNNGTSMKIHLKLLANNGFTIIRRITEESDSVYTHHGLAERHSNGKEILLNDPTARAGKLHFRIELNQLILTSNDGPQLKGAVAGEHILHLKQAQLQGERWTIVEKGNPSTVFPSGQLLPFFEIRDNGIQFSANGGCNTISGGLSIKGNELNFSGTASTKMHCAKMEGERYLMGLFQGMVIYKIQGDELVLRNASNQFTIRCKADFMR
jgi:heat shock protein HslJ